MQALLNTAVKAARRAGDLALRYLNQADRLDIRSKGRNEFVTQVDKAAEDLVIETIREWYPDHAFLGEEGGASGDSEFRWIIDPLDGTTNYIHGFPVFAVSIALEVKGELQTGVIYDPTRQEIFTAIRGGGAQLEGRRIRISKRQSLEGALIGTDFLYRDDQQWIKNHLAMVESVLKETAGIRRAGAAALDLAYVAAGRLDGIWESGLKIWDIAAGTLIIREAGGIISGLDDEENYLETGNIVAGTPKVHDALKDLLARHKLK
jgi:myo-inositol-1(or 4)-monophosphatase